MSAENPKLKLFIDSVAVLVSISVIQCGFAYLSFDEQINMERLVTNSVVGFLMYFTSLCIFTCLGTHTRFMPTLYSVLLGSIVWNIYYSVLMIRADNYLSDHPEAFYQRFILPEALAFGVLVPLFTVISLSLIMLARFLTGSKLADEMYK